ncbi:MAG TPA: hypothetical protein PLR85_18075 [Nitrospira sp.]|nr:hypothetical protein [Nitrospira sp.]
MLSRLRLTVRRGASADIALRLETSAKKFAAITGMSKTAPLRVTAAGHGIPDMWYAAVIDARGMVEMNAADSNKIRESEFHQVAVIDANTVDFTGLSAAGFKTYTGGGHLAYYAPMDLTGYTSARMDIKRRVGGDVELALNTENGTLEIDSSTHSVWIRLNDTHLAALPAMEYVFDIELVSATAVDAICSADSVLDVLPEVTTSA